jgi:hypothetical protein
VRSAIRGLPNRRLKPTPYGARATPAKQSVLALPARTVVPLDRARLNRGVRRTTKLTARKEKDRWARHYPRPRGDA